LDSGPARFTCGPDAPIGASGNDDNKTNRYFKPRVIDMKTHFTGLAVAVLLAIGPTLPGHAQDAATPPPAASQNDAPPATVARPSIAPKTAEPAAAPAAAEPAARPQRRYVHRSPRRHGFYRTAYWQPFPIYWPRFHRSRIYWSRIPWIF
jgi:hypothetical protein